MADLDIKTLSEISDELNERAKSVRVADIHVGRWSVDWKTLELVFDNSSYRVDLERCSTSAEVLDWIFHLRGKSGLFNNSDLADLVQMIYVVLDPCANLCSSGQEKGPSTPWVEQDYFDQVAKRFTLIK